MPALVIAGITNPFHGEIIRGARSAEGEAGHVVLPVDAQKPDRMEREALERALPTVEGVVLASSRMPDSAIRRTVRQWPVIVSNRHVALTRSAEPRRSAGALTHGRDSGTLLAEVARRSLDRA